MLRILHTADWHLGHTLHDQSREYEHDRFLDWLLDRLEEERVDALLVAGDVFDSANPPASAQRQWYGFLARARARVPHLQVVVIGGNHDAPARLDAPRPILDGLGVHVVGALPHAEGRALDLDRLLIPLKDRQGAVQAWAVAVPFLRPADLPAPSRDAAGDDALLRAGDTGDPDPLSPLLDPETDPLIDGVRRVYREAVEAACARRTDGQAVVALGHLYMARGALSELSERKILGGNQHALPADLFPPEVAYAALGHLHLAQKVGERGHVRYAGSPLPLSLSEARYEHQVLVVDLAGPEVAQVRALPVPRTVPLLRVPERGAAPVEAVTATLAAGLPAADQAGDGPWPYLEVCVRLDAPDPDLRRRIDAALEGRAARLLKIGVEYGGSQETLSESRPRRHLQDLDPEEVFRQCWARSFEGEPTDDLMAAFRELLEEASHDPEEVAA